MSDLTAAVEAAMHAMYGDHPHAENYRAHVQVGITAAAAIIRADERTKVAEVAEQARRFWSQVDQRDASGCWLWTGTRNGGYGQFHPTRTTLIRAHRWAYQQLVGPIPEALTLDHLCRNRACVKPAHMEPATRGENALRGNGPSALNARKTHCPQGHPYDVANTYVDKRGRRACKACKKVHQAAFLARKALRPAETAVSASSATPESPGKHDADNDHDDRQER